MSRKIAILNYKSFSGNFSASIDGKKKEENAMSMEFNESNVGKD